MELPETLTWRERSVLRSAKRAASWPQWARAPWYAAMAALVGWYVWDGVALWDVDRPAAHGEFIKAALLAVASFLATEFDLSLRLLARLGGTEHLPDAHPTRASGEASARESGPSVLADAEVRRLARAPVYADQLERLRWLHPIVTVVAVGSAVVALAWVDIPRPLDLVVAGLAGLSVAAAIAVAALRGWVRLAVALARSRAAAG